MINYNRFRQGMTYYIQYFDKSTGTTVRNTARTPIELFFRLRTAMGDSKVGYPISIYAYTRAKEVGIELISKGDNLLKSFANFLNEMIGCDVRIEKGNFANEYHIRYEDNYGNLRNLTFGLNKSKVPVLIDTISFPDSFAQWLGSSKQEIKKRYGKEKAAK